MFCRPFNFLLSIFLNLLLNLIMQAHARPMYTDVSNSTFPLVLCGNLQDAVLALKHREVLEHEIGADWLEVNCVSIDPCTQKSSNEDSIFAMQLPALAGVLLSGNSSALRLPASSDHQNTISNLGSIEFARVPEGLRLQACAPDFDLLRREGRLACNDETIVVINADANTRACPGTLSYSILDCLKTVQFDAGVETLVLRPPTQKMHFGQATWEQACATELVLPAIVRAVCSSLAEYTISIPVPADMSGSIGSTSLVMYDFLQGYGCHDVSDLQGLDKVLSRKEAPNRVVTCPQVANGTQQRSDPYTCATVCNPGFVLETSGVDQLDRCVSVCHGMLSSCPIGYFATNECHEGSLSVYNCSLCDAHPGYGVELAVPGKDNVFACHYVACTPGTRSNGFACEACAVNTFSNTSSNLVCSDCDTLVTGTYQQLTGQTSCSTCMWNTEASALECPQGTSFVNDFQRLQFLFSLYAEDHNAHLQDYVAKICRMGFACLPCEPGHFEHDRACEKCAYGSYQPNFGAQECYKCANGQNTTSLGSTRSSHCVCDPGFE